MQLPDWIPDRIRSRITVEDHGHTTLCWSVSGWNDGKGHAKIRWWGRCTFTHIVCWCIKHGLARSDVKGVLDHLCRNESCCNPDHLEDVTVKVNTDRGYGRHNQFKPADSYERDWREPLDRAFG